MNLRHSHRLSHWCKHQCLHQCKDKPHHPARWKTAPGGWLPDIGIHVANTGIQVQGGTGYIEESGAPQFLRDSRITAIYEGTNGIQAMDLIDRKVARDGGVAVRVLTDVILSADKDLAAVGNADIQVVRGSLALAVANLTNATNVDRHISVESEPGCSAGEALRGFEADVHL